MLPAASPSFMPTHSQPLLLLPPPPSIRCAGAVETERWRSLGATPFLFDTASMPSVNESCSHCPPDEYKEMPYCCGVCVFSYRWVLAGLWGAVGAWRRRPPPAGGVQPPANRRCCLDTRSLARPMALLSFLAGSATTSTPEKTRQKRRWSGCWGRVCACTTSLPASSLPAFAAARCG